MPPLAAIPFVAKFLGLPAWLRNLISGALAIALAALAFLWWLDRHTDAAVEADRKEQAAAVAIKSQAATDLANERDAVRQLDNAIKSERTSQAIASAAAVDPVAAAKPAGAVTRAAVDSLRDRK